MAVKKEFSFNEEQFTAMLQDAVNKVNNEEDPEELDALKKLFKKIVPFSRRGYVSAYMAKQLFGGNSGRGYHGRNSHERPARHERFQSSSVPPRQREKPVVESMGTKPPVPRAIIAEEFAKTIFVSIGRNRHVFARDLIALISQAGSVERERIGDIKVYDNYSFVTLFAEDAEKVIELLNGMEYRGRKLSVSYSRKKDDAGSSAEQTADSTETAAEPAQNTESVSE